MAVAERSRQGRASGTDLSEDEIVERIFEAVIEQRLPPGTKLAELALCEAFGVGRMRIRRSLLRLASREIVELHPNRGAFVASPTPDQANEIFEARQALEPTIARLAVERASDAEIADLCRHIEAEEAAHRQNRRRDAIRLSGQFHGLLAQTTGNSVLMRMMRDLIPRTSLMIGLFSRAGTASCRVHDHTAIVEALGSRDADRAAETMRQHLAHIKDYLDLSHHPAGAVDLVAVFN